MKRKNRILLVAGVVVLLLAGTMTGIYARYTRLSNEAANTFSPAPVSNPEVSETFNGNEKKDVAIKVPDNGYPVYVRAKIVITWKKENPEYPKYSNQKWLVYYKMPEEEHPVLGENDEPVYGDDGNAVREGDYVIDLNLKNDGWKYDNKDGFYYYTKPVDSGESTAILINSCTLSEYADPPAGYTLSVEIITQTVQAVGWTDDNTSQAYQDAWGEHIS